MARTIVIGYGNSLRGDDAVGCIAADRIAQLGYVGVSVVSCHQLVPELAAELSQFDCAIFIDASVQESPGVLSVRQLDVSHESPAPLSHHIDPASLLNCAAHIYGRAPEAFLVTVGSDSFEFMADLSEPVKARMPELIETVTAIINSKRIHRQSTYEEMTHERSTFSNR